MIRLLGQLGLICLIFLGVYLAAMLVQSHAAEELCAGHPPGTETGNLADLDGSRFLRSMGVISDPKNPRLRSVLYCATVTFCDTSCSLVVEDGVVVRAVFRGH